MSSITEQCQCSLENDQFTDSRFVCSENSPKKVNFFSNITGTLQTPVIDLRGHLESWMTSGTKVTVQQQSLDIDRNCMVDVSSTEECALELMQESVNRPVNVPTISILGVLVCGLILCLLVAAMVYYFSKKRIKPSEVKQKPSPS